MKLNTRSKESSEEAGEEIPKVWVDEARGLSLCRLSQPDTSRVHPENPAHYSESFPCGGKSGGREKKGGEKRKFAPH